MVGDFGMTIDKGSTTKDTAGEGVVNMLGPVGFSLSTLSIKSAGDAREVGQVSRVSATAKGAGGRCRP